MYNKTHFLHFFADPAFINVLDFLIENNLGQYTKKEVARNSKISVITLRDVWKKLQHFDLIFHTKIINGKKYYRTNNENQIIIHLIHLNFHISKNSRR